MQHRAKVNVSAYVRARDGLERNDSFASFCRISKVTISFENGQVMLNLSFQK